MTSTNPTPRRAPRAALTLSLSAAALALLSSLSPTAATAQEAHPCASLAEAPFNNYERLEREGVDAYKAKRYADAIKSFETARALCDKSQSLIFALGRSYHLSGDCQKASTFYRKALQLEGKKLDDISNRLTEAESECAARPGTLEVACTQPGVSVSVNGATPTPCPLSASFPPGPVSVYATLADHQPYTADARVESNTATTVRIPALTPVEADTPIVPLPPPPQSKALLISGWATAGVGIVSLSVGAALLASAESTRDEVTSTLRAAGTQTVTSLTRQDALSKQEDADSAATTGAVLLGVGGAALATGAILLILHYTDDSSPPSSVGLAPLLGPDQVGLWMSASF
jgi:tetratricopeptide (TPR) repeat protein